MYRFIVGNDFGCGLSATNRVVRRQPHPEPQGGSRQEWIKNNGIA